MKAIIIRSVSNGWIVEEMWASDPGAARERAVFNQIADLQAALPNLLKENEAGPHTAVIPSRQFDRKDYQQPVSNL